MVTTRQITASLPSAAQTIQAFKHLATNHSLAHIFRTSYWTTFDLWVQRPLREPVTPHYQSWGAACVWGGGWGADSAAQVPYRNKCERINRGGPHPQPFRSIRCKNPDQQFFCGNLPPTEFRRSWVALNQDFRSAASFTAWWWWWLSSFSKEQEGMTPDNVWPVWLLKRF